MHRVLIADYDTDFADLLCNQISNRFAVEICSDIDTVLEMIHRFEPDIIVMDAFLSGVNGWSVLQILADTGRMPGVILTSRNTEEYVLNRFAKLGVMNLFVKPCKISGIAACINEVSSLLCNMPERAWCVENELDNILLRLMFQIGTKGYNTVYHAIMQRYEDPNATVTKHIYPQIAKKYGGDVRRAEKTIRYTIATAFTCGDMNVWKCFFQPGHNDELQCPSNDVFIGRIAGCLHQRERIMPPYKAARQKNA